MAHVGEPLGRSPEVGDALAVTLSRGVLLVLEVERRHGTVQWMRAVQLDGGLEERSEKPFWACVVFDANGIAIHYTRLC